MNEHLKRNWSNYFQIYVFALIFFGVFFLYSKHDVGNDSSISDWLINYEGGFVRRGLIGELMTNFSIMLSLKLRDTILIFQLLFFTSYYFLIILFCKNLLQNRLIILAIFSPIFILYPVAEIEALGRKELIIFLIFLSYLLTDIKNFKVQIIYKVILFPISILTWEPVFIFFSFVFLIDLFVFQIRNFDKKFFYLIASYLISIFLVILIYLNPFSQENHNVMRDFLNNEFGEICYMSCDFVGQQSSNSFSELYQTFLVKFKFTYALRYLIIILIGFFPLYLLSTYSKINHKKQILIISKCKNLFFPFLLAFLPSTVLYLVMYDWARVVHISYSFSLLTFLYLIKENFIEFSKQNVQLNYISKLSKKIFILVFFLFAFSWNPKVVMPDDVASKPIYATPYKFYKYFIRDKF
tara:strand:+ start:1090 stop:2319 length:1230 start_codon:yes stop_codon:yes gene_type:complete